MLLLAECSNGRLKVLVNRDMGEDINKRLLVSLSFNLLSLKLLDDPSVQDLFGSGSFLSISVSLWFS